MKTEKENINSIKALEYLKKEKPLRDFHIIGELKN